MRRWVALGALLVASQSLGARTGVAQDGSKEIRDFNILVDGKERGKYRMTISRHTDGTEIMAGEADLKINYLVYAYQYSARGTETWKDGRLLELANVSNYNGKKYNVNAVNRGNVLAIKVNGHERAALPDVWVTTYWRLPDTHWRNRPLPLLETDTGKNLSAELKQVGMSNLTIAGTPQKCSHFRVSGGVKVDLWYDQAERLVRKESVESDHRTVLELNRIRR